MNSLEDANSLTFISRIRGDDTHGYYVRIPKSFITYALLDTNKKYYIKLTKIEQKEDE